MQISRLLFKSIHLSRLAAAVFIAMAISATGVGAQVPDPLVVDTTADSSGGDCISSCSLRDAITIANDPAADRSTITFDPTLAGGTINLTSDLPEITEGVTINGSAAAGLVVDGSGTDTPLILRVETDATVRDLGLEGAPLEIDDGVSLSFDVRGADQQFDDVIRDAEVDAAGRLVKQGSSMLTLRGENTYSGGTSVQAGTLRGDTKSLQGDITNSATVIFDEDTGADTDGEYAGTMTGTGSVEKTGTGEVTFSGNNTYAGGTTISAGSLRGDSGSLQGNIAVSNGAAVFFGQDGDGIYSGNLTGAGEFTKEGAGTLELTGTNTISGPSSLEAGALLGGYAAIPRNLSSGAGTLVTFEHDDDGTYVGSISGMAGVTKIGTGTLRFSGNNSYEGVTTVSDGTLIADPLRMPNQMTSSIVNDSELVFDSSGTGTYQGIISGTGDFTKAGSGTLSLTNDHTFTGTTSITAGRLDVDGGSLATGAVDVGASAVLGGDLGSIGGPVTVNGTIAPGNSVGTLTVDSVDFASGSVFAVEVDEPSGMADRLVVIGDADIGGASLQVDPGAGSYATPVDVTILTAGDVLNDFASFEEDFPFLDITYMLTPTTVELRILNNGNAVSGFAQTPNQETIAAALEEALDAAQMGEGDPDIETVFDSIFGLTTSQIPPALDSMTGETLSQFAATRLATAQRFGRTLDARIRDHQWGSNEAFISAGTGTGEASDLAANSMYPESSPVFGVAMLGVGPMGAPGVGTRTKSDSWIRTWIDGSGIYGDVDGDSNSSDFDYTIWGGSLGLDVLLADHWVVGLAGGYANTDLDFSARTGDGEIDTYQAALYAGYVDPRFHVGVSGRYAYNDIDAKREIQFINRKATADPDGNDFGARLEGGLNLFDLGGIVLQPIASVNYNHLSQDSYTESGAMSLNLALEDYDIDSLVTGLGMRVRGRWQIGQDLWMVPELHGRWLHEFLDTDRLIEARLTSAPVGASAFRIQGAELPRDSGNIGITWSVITDSAWAVIGSYDAILNGDLVQHVGSLTLNFEW